MILNLKGSNKKPKPIKYAPNVIKYSPVAMENNCDAYYIMNNHFHFLPISDLKMTSLGGNQHLV